MKIGIDVQTTQGQKTGFGFYVENLVKELKQIDRANKYYYFTPKTEEDFSMPKRFFWDQIFVPLRAYKNRVDIFHQPCFSLPILFRGKIIATIHDLIAIKFPHDIPFFSRQFFSRWMPFSYRKADHIICTSEHTKQDLIAIAKIPSSKISVIPLAANDYFKPARHKILPPQKFNIKHPYFLHVGTLNPRKNLIFLVEVFAEVIKRFPNYQLVLIGKKGWYFETLFAKITQLGITQKVIFLDYISEEEKLILYQNAFGFLFPSIYEGFGLPPLEAMKCGVPVVASNVSSIPEVVGDAGILVSLTDKKGWVSAVQSLIEKPQYRQNLIMKGFQQADKFSWRFTAEKTLEIYEKVYRQ
ncbi:hypothetical protein CO101_03400 [Candidatus Berkelbacteria bacterium CG_4_9_14_3_um_filter_39_23]|uniref:Glycosyltransferase family 1 protein n=2 Tax=Candidatus Berkelbacteria TaxID=1618330 RepID=A0A2M7CHE4_9BACT|nr:glycosyltransferase family 4 protein [Candidatus Berkelbacteria bacterium]PIR27913.1 MAG: hypothetical protein COV39_01950 [Candidatus Berkelbacteria bacterium CG11_big_fil_rev_8_21_14_0_20_40_23]PIV25063.1 MAG: hypothetical protein COS38_03635 [Candidatus Berkelbacteria bacterium CG03_land_8_20_14_0_80_40_36]PIZ28703.1 MAG: hypothetical protein COY44_02780 [Candidatus Berkelbacteria bacterium CG_4_10_14_0_8_um_filter_39_42]PJB50949.1 MAG: hypothetical protein CO101_03400 [Candidatus Berkelb